MLIQNRFFLSLYVHFRENRYQSSFESFAKQGYSQDQAISLMHKAVQLADECIGTHRASKGKSKEALGNGVGREASVVLALSCYGAILSPGQEYTGQYPSPYGHPSHSSLSDSNQSSKNELKSNWLPEAEQQLEEWHYNRLKVFASDMTTWTRVAYVAFETLPVLYEARAIRRAMTRLKAYLTEQDSGAGKSHWPSWWISFVFPDGHLPYRTSLEPGDTSPSNIVKTLFQYETLGLPMSAQAVELEAPNGLGINCTKMRYLPGLVEDMSKAVKDMSRPTGESEPCLVLYPDGGLVYDPATKTWHQDSAALPSDSTTLASTSVEAGTPAQVWASQLFQIADRALQPRQNDKPVWDGAILGGCCKASPAYIAELSKLVRKQSPAS